MRKSRYMGPSLTVFGKTRASVIVEGIWCGRVYRREGRQCGQGGWKVGRREEQGWVEGGYSKVQKVAGCR
jgi:hypothetical protein